MKQMTDLTGQRYGLLTVVEFVALLPGGHSQWVCQCDCGARKVIKAKNFRSGSTRSCGCYRASLKPPDSLTHGHAQPRTPTYLSWASMIQRCRNPRNTHYSYYGGRGITVCDEWGTFANFLADMGDRPEGLTLDRIDPDGNYEPGNCRWATRSEQQRNQRPRRQKEVV